MDNWWVEYKTSGNFATPFTPCKPAIQSCKRPVGNYWGPFHCSECANVCASFGKTEKQAFEFNHGTDDEKFGVFLSI